MIKDKVSGDKLIEKMKRLINIIHQGECFGEEEESLKYAVGDVLSTLEIFTFTNLDESEQEVMFTWAKMGLENRESSIINKHWPKTE